MNQPPHRDSMFVSNWRMHIGDFGDAQVVRKNWDNRTTRIQRDSTITQLYHRDLYYYLKFRNSLLARQKNIWIVILWKYLLICTLQSQRNAGKYTSPKDLGIPFT